MSEIVDYSARSFPVATSTGPAFPMNPIGRAIILTVLCKRTEGTFKAYTGIVPNETADWDPEYENACLWVQANGTQIRFEEAKAIFGRLNLAGVRYAA